MIAYYTPPNPIPVVRAPISTDWHGYLFGLYVVRAGTFGGLGGVGFALSALRNCNGRPEDTKTEQKPPIP